MFLPLGLQNLHGSILFNPINNKTNSTGSAILSTSSFGEENHMIQMDHQSSAIMSQAVYFARG
jgi:hypothetical protein